MLEIEDYEIRLAAGESALIEFEVEAIDLGNMTGDITGYFDLVEGSKNPCFNYIFNNPKRRKTIKLSKVSDNKFVLFFKSSDTYNLPIHNYWALRFTNGENSVIPIINQRLFVRRLGYGKSSCLPIADKQW